MIVELKSKRVAVHMRGAPYSTWCGRVEYAGRVGLELRTRRTDGKGGYDYTTHIIPWTSVERVEVLGPDPNLTPWP